MSERPGNRLRGAVAHQAGRMAEAQVARWYEGRGLAVHATRWRGQGGEIDLILADGAGFVLVEVKRARDLAAAAHRLQPAQMARLLAAGAEFLGAQPAGLATPARFDVALVDGQGRVEVIENALGA
ncbi:YraN family protein [Pararhodobacter sp. SW119]|uniref:YraN family protein n=1 Tax=Pararhodobacter sp. SW119 TaxID=2780075 RepID=UPI001AE0CBCD|nr:YraN family protein [Pararhodobacter sp. SW119]